MCVVLSKFAFPHFFLNSVTRCQRLLPPFNGFFVGHCGDTYGSRCVMGCNEGYYLNGSASTTCLVKPGHLTGYWDTPFPTCRSKHRFSLAGQLSGCGLCSKFELYELKLF